MNRVAALPMYNVTPALAAEWRAFLADVLKIRVKTCMRCGAAPTS
jgi:hypothetical protein